MTNPSPDRCRNGHERTTETTLITADGSRNCRICRANNSARYRQAQPVQASLPFGPLAEWIRVHYDRPPTVRAIVELVGIGRNKAHRWTRTGRLTIDDADLAAIRLGHHPVEIWRDDWLEVA